MTAITVASGKQQPALSGSDASLDSRLDPWRYYHVACGTHTRLRGDGHDDPLRQSYLATTGRNLLILHLLEALFPEFAGVRMLLIKGLALLPAYPEIGLRPLSDADILVAPSDFPRVRDRLLELGFHPEPVHNADYDVAYCGELAFSRPEADGVFRLDVHWGLLTTEWLDNDGLPDFDELWARCRPGPFPAQQVRVLGPEDLLLHICLHQALHHSFGGVLPSVDVDLLLRSCRIDWGLLLRLAERSGWSPAVYLALARSRALAEAEVPEAVLRELHPPRWRIRLIERISGADERGDLQPAVGEQAARLLQLALNQRLGTVLGMVGRALFPSNRWLVLRYAENSGRSAARLRLRHSARLIRLCGMGLSQLRRSFQWP